ncbi:hypothetical protein [Lysinibacillus sphaericus]|uniref:hypothetical protein n=1 Tax=Lysinibacillus sphaericus TaxID=1421 RepID=UPI0004DECE36|nr:hypothetical protein [Lysinibacillus sphaericus]QPA58352.1 hypothetical protein INQ55_20165 [Lysinibacillus sphaericus]
MKKTILSLGLSLTLLTGTVGTVNANEVDDSQYSNKEVDAEIFLNGIKYFKDEPTNLEASSSVVESIYLENFPQWNVIVAFMYKDNLYMRYEDFIDIIKPDKFNFVPDQSEAAVGPYFLEIEKYGQVMKFSEYYNELKTNNKKTNGNIPIPFTGSCYGSKTMFIPVRAVGEALGLKVNFFGSKNSYSVTIKENQDEHTVN